MGMGGFTRAPTRQVPSLRRSSKTGSFNHTKILQKPHRIKGINDGGITEGRGWVKRWDHTLQDKMGSVSWVVVWCRGCASLGGEAHGGA
jgi:hypothetical protein